VKVLRLDEVEATPILGLRWIPIRSTLGIESFGINAYEAVAAGAPVGEPYLPAPGEARFLEARAS
jgi:hypothetical protein